MWNERFQHVEMCQNERFQPVEICHYERYQTADISMNTKMSIDCIGDTFFKPLCITTGEGQMIVTCVTKIQQNLQGKKTLGVIKVPPIFLCDQMLFN